MKKKRDHNTNDKNQILTTYTFTEDDFNNETWLIDLFLNEIVLNLCKEKAGRVLNDLGWQATISCGLT